MTGYHRHRHHDRNNPPPPSAWRRAGWDEVRTPFGLRIVPRGQGWAEAAKWAVWRAMMWIISIAVLALGGLWVHAYLIAHAAR